MAIVAGINRKMRAGTALTFLLAMPALAQTVAETPPAVAIQSPVDALAQDAGEYARRYGTTLAEAMRRLEAQQDTVAATDDIRTQYQDRLAGIAIEHAPVYRIVVLLTGAQPVADMLAPTRGSAIPITFRTGAAATRAQVLAAIADHQAAIRAALLDPPGMGADPRTGGLAIMISPRDADRSDLGDLTSRFARLAGVPVGLHVLGRSDADFQIAGGGRVTAVDKAAHRRFNCTAGFVVTDGARDGIATAAHCPDALDYAEPGKPPRPLAFVGGWGAGFQDVQVNAAPGPLDPLFYADAAKTLLRRVTSWRNRESTRAGDFVCHRGEHSGYSCAEVVMADYAPAGDLCYGPCPPDWVAVEGPGCGGGDSGGPVFSATIAFGILKGGSYRPDGRCDLYYYMSTDYLPVGWRLLL